MNLGLFMVAIGLTVILVNMLNKWWDKKLIESFPEENRNQIKHLVLITKLAIVIAVLATGASLDFNSQNDQLYEG